MKQPLRNSGLQCDDWISVTYVICTINPLFINSAPRPMLTISAKALMFSSASLILFLWAGLSKNYSTANHKIQWKGGI